LKAFPSQKSVATPHSIADGTSMMLILHDLLTFYESPHLEQTLMTEYPTSAHHLFPPLDKKQMRSLQVNRYSQDQNKEQSVQNKMKAQAKTYKNVVPHVPFKKSRPKPSKMPTKITLGVGTPEGSDKILKFCRKNGITIGTYLTAAFAFINSKITVILSNRKKFNFFRMNTAKTSDSAWTTIYETDSQRRWETPQLDYIFARTITSRMPSWTKRSCKFLSE
jgi:hypothetical protein